MPSGEIKWIDGVGNVLEGSTYIGTYDAVTGKCELYNGTEMPCPSTDPQDIKQPTVGGAQTYWWLFLVFFSLAVIVFAWWLNRKK